MQIGKFYIFFNNFIIIFTLLFAAFLLILFANYCLKREYQIDLAWANFFGINTNNKWFKYRRIIKSKSIKFVDVFFIVSGLIILMSLVISFLLLN